MHQGEHIQVDARLFHFFIQLQFFAIEHEKRVQDPERYGRLTAAIEGADINEIIQARHIFTEKLRVSFLQERHELVKIFRRIESMKDGKT